MNKNIIVAASAVIAGLIALIALTKRKKKQIVKKRMIDLIGKTPLIYIKSLSDALGC